MKRRRPEYVYLFPSLEASTTTTPAGEDGEMHCASKPLIINAGTMVELKRHVNAESEDMRRDQPSPSIRTRVPPAEGPALGVRVANVSGRTDSYSRPVSVNCAGQKGSVSWKKEIDNKAAFVRDTPHLTGS